jgi:hypothetical protein
MPAYQGTTKGFKRSGTLLSPQIRKGAETRGFAVSRVLTHWPEIAGQDIAAIARPVKVSYARHGLGATLTVLTTGAQAPMLEMQKEKLRDRVNAAYGYNAIARVQITQTAPTGFAEGQAQFDHRPAETPKPAPDRATTQAASELAAPVTDEGLREALESLGRNVLSKRST